MTARKRPAARLVNARKAAADAGALDDRIGDVLAGATGGRHCRAACVTRNHASFGECVRASGIQIDRESLR